MAVRFLKVDGVRLKKAFEDRSIVMTKASYDMGFDRSYLSGIIYSGKIRKSTADYLDMVYGIPYEEYKPLPIPEPIPEIPEVQNEEPLPWDNPLGINDDLTYEPIKKGAFEVTLSDETIQKIGKVIYEQVKKAWNE